MAGRFEGSLRPLPPVGIINGASVSIMSWERGTMGTSSRSALPLLSWRMVRLTGPIATAIHGILPPGLPRWDFLGLPFPKPRAVSAAV